LENLGEQFHAPDVLFKYHAACYGTHGPIEAALKAADHPAFDADLIEKVDIVVAQHCIGMCDISEPTTGLEGKFSLTHNVALGLLKQADGALDLYDDARMTDQAPSALRKKVNVSSTDKIGAFEANITVHLSNGIVIRETHDADVPERDLDLQWEKLERKFRTLTTPILGESKVEKIIELVHNLDDADRISPLMEAVRN
jgi:2-methylcitrate dehydratase PrpD